MTASAPPLSASPVVPGLVSVVVPCYNYGEYLAGCVSSVLDRQDGTAVEVIIVDDCSSDSTEEVGRRLQAQDPRVRYVRHEANWGHIATYNDGLSLVSGEFVALLSADDLLTPHALSRAVAALGDPGVAFVFGPVHHLVDTSQDVDPGAWGAEDRRQTSHVESGRHWAARVCRAARNPVASPEVVARTSAQRAVGGYRRDLPHSGDLEMWLRLATMGAVAQLQGPNQAIRRMHAANMSAGYTTAADLREVERAFDVFESYAASVWPDWPRSMPRVHRVLARRAVRMGLDGLAVPQDPNQPDLDELLEFVEQVDPIVARCLGARLLNSARHDKAWALALLPVRNESIALARRARGAALAVRARMRSRGPTTAPLSTRIGEPEVRPQTDATSGGRAL